MTIAGSVTKSEIMPEPGLTDRVMPRLLSRLSGEGNFLTPAQQWGLRAIPAQIEAMARGEAGKKFLLSSLPMGMGKTTAVAETVVAMLDDPTYTNVGILILVNQLNLIVPLIERMGLDLDDPRLAVRVGEDNMKRTKLLFDLNDLGVGSDQKAQRTAQVMISSQQKFVRMAAQPWRKDFEENTFYHYEPEKVGEGKRRQVVVWDEAAAPIHPITLMVKQIRDYAGVIYAEERPVAAENLMQWANELESTTTTVSRVPIWGAIDELLAMEWDQLPDPEDEPEFTSVGWALEKLQGHQVSIHHDNYSGGGVAVSYIEALPKEFAPVLILDAFGKDRNFYRAWADHRGNLEFLAEAPKTYRNLTIHWRKDAAGKAAHRTPKQRDKIVKAGIEAHFAAGAPMLNIKHKMDKSSYDIEPDIKRGIKAKGGDPEPDAFLTWGLHTGTNDYLNRKQIFVGGLWRKPISVYKAIFRGVAQMSPAMPLDDTQLVELALSEVAHDLQQAVGRIAVRTNVDGDCPKDCHLWITSSDAGNMPFTKAHFEKTFPGAVIVPWNPTPTLHKGGKVKTDNRARFFKVLCAQEGEWFGVKDFEPDFSEQMVRRYLTTDEPFKQYLKAQGVEIETRRSKRLHRRGASLAKEYRLMRTVRAAA